MAYKTISMLMIVSITLCLVCTSAFIVDAQSVEIFFQGTISQMFEESIWINGEHFFVFTLIASVETNAGESYALIYTDLQPLARTESKWKQYIAKPVESVWDFGDGSFFEATGTIIGAQYWVRPPGLEFPPGTPAPIQQIGTFNIDEGLWEGKNILGGQANYRYSINKEDYFGTPLPGPFPVSGIIQGSIQVEN